MDSIRQDVRFGLRGFGKRPGWTASAVVTMALGIGATASMFSVVHGVLVRPLPLHEPGSLVLPDVISPLGYEISLSIPNFRDWRDRNRTLSSFGANAFRSKTLTGGDRPEVVVTRLILGDYFETLGVRPALGRTIRAEETWAGAEPVAVVSHAFWSRRLGARPEALGSTIVLDAEPFTIVGVMPPQFTFPSADTGVFLPMGYFSERLCWEERDCSQGTWAVGRLGPGVALEAAQADLERIAAQIASDEGEELAVARLRPLADAYVGDIRARLWILMGAVGFVLLIACANVAGLLLARGEGRRREVALRNALGAGRGRLVRQLLTESLLLAAAAGALGVGLAWLGVRLMRPWVEANVPSVVAGRVGLDLPVVAFTCVVSLVAGLSFGIVPALRSTRTDLARELKQGGRSSGSRTRQRIRSALVVGEVALSLVLLVGAGLMLESLRELGRVDRGFRGDRVLTARVTLPAVHFSEKRPTWQFYERLLERLRALPGVREVSCANAVPLEGSSWEREIWPEGMPIEPPTASSVLFHMVAPSHFDVLGIPLVRGRVFDRGDSEDADLVAIVDDTMAERFWPGENPIGKRVTFETLEDSGGDGPGAEERVWRTVVGVTRNVRHYELESPSRIQVWVPMAQSGRAWSRDMRILVQTEGDPRALTEAVRGELAALSPDVPLARVETIRGYVDRALSGTRIVGVLLTAFSLVAVSLAAIGVFGLMSHTVVQRLREIGIRMALGARAGDVLRLILRRGLALTAGGAAVGLAAALALSRLMAGMLYRVEPVNVTTYAAVTAFLIAVSLVATWLPLRRATRVDPSIVLREE